MCFGSGFIKYDQNYQEAIYALRSLISVNCIPLINS